MTKLFLALILVFGCIGCQPPTETIDYLGQSEPDTIPVIFAPDLVSVKGRLEHGISFTPDTKEVAFGILDKDDFSGDIFYAKKEDGQWTAPHIFGPLKRESVFLPYFSPDGRSLLYAKSKSDSSNYTTDIWIYNKNNNYWNYTEKVNGAINTSTREASACMTLNNTIYFSSNRDGNGLADLYVSTLDNRLYTNAKRIQTISSGGDEESIYVAPDERYIIFSRYSTLEKGPDLWISYQDAKSNWTTPRLLDTIINTTHWERRPFVSNDNNFLFYTTLMFNESLMTEADIYWVGTQKVFKPFVFNPIIETTIKVGKETTVTLPSDYFKDIDNEKLTIRLKNETLSWATFDAKKMTLAFQPKEIGEFEVVFTATDPFLNETDDRIKIIVEK
ncbi:hypothetical protein [uncultured Dokdonia sp.]|uniref:hypothetical protein n=1 Tax=uncultured Dokdonia sp. TaxID=575653 RepID=UPI00261C4160|nr:hypothetical protein [uncultured Dokdonia sp.]